VFRQRFETKAMNTAVSLAVDCSGSMAGDRIKLAGVASYALACVLERLKITYEVIGFTSTHSSEMTALMRDEAKESPPGERGVGYSRCEPIYMPVFKPFGGKLDAQSRSRMAHLMENPSWLMQNVDGESVQLAARRLAQQNAERRIMIVLSDGEPCCMSGRGLKAHLKKVVKDLTAQKIEMIGVGIQTRSVKDYYPNSVVINDVEELPTQVMKELTKMLLAA
jgi:cobalamin biosynthesis protein CobT